MFGTKCYTTSGSGNTVTIALTNGTNGQLLTAGGSTPTWSSVVAGMGISITPGAEQSFHRYNRINSCYKFYD